MHDFGISYRDDYCYVHHGAFVLINDCILDVCTVAYNSWLRTTVLHKSTNVSMEYIHLLRQVVRHLLRQVVRITLNWCTLSTIPHLTVVQPSSSKWANEY
jgi:hypothetical protein